MRWFDEYLGLLATASAFGAIVMIGSGAGRGPALLFVALAGAALAAMTWRTTRTPRVLVVGEPRGRPLYRLREELDEGGFALRFCPGPAGRPCPVFQGKPCPAGGHPVGAVIFRRAGEVGPVPPCGLALGGIPSLTLEEGSAREPAVGPRRGGMGWDRGPAAAVEVLTRMAERRGR
jgi:hypothetical protein